MPASDRKLDVWVIELNQVYGEVPFTVVADWLQQGRLLADDRVRLHGQQKWHPITKVPALVPYLPQPEPAAAEDAAEALAPVDLGLQWSAPQEDEDEDVDMIPLIDISLVLLIFFMMTASVSKGLFTPIDTPGAVNQLHDVSTDMFWIGIDTKGAKGETKGQEPWFSFGQNQADLVSPTVDWEAVRTALRAKFVVSEGEAKIALRADRKLPVDTVVAVTQALQELEADINRSRRGKQQLNFTILGEVSEPQR